MKKYIEATFQGFWIDRAKDKVPAESGVFAVFEGFYHETDDQVELNKLIYVGEADNVRDAVSDKTKLEEWREESAASADLFFSFTPIEGDDRSRVAAGIVFEQKPTANADKYSFPFDETELRLFGKTGLLNTTFAVCKADPDEVQPDPEDIEIDDTIESDE